MSDAFQPELWMTVGLPRSGKTTWARSTGHPIVCPDAIRLALHGQAFVASAEPVVWSTAKLMVAALFEAGHRVVILDACSGTKKRRDEWVDSRWLRCVRVFDRSADDCYEQAENDGRMELCGPINRMAREWEAPDEIPSRDHLPVDSAPWVLTVCSLCGGGFRVPPGTDNLSAFVGACCDTRPSPWAKTRQG